MKSELLSLSWDTYFLGKSSPGCSAAPSSPCRPRHQGAEAEHQGVKFKNCQDFAFRSDGACTGPALNDFLEWYSLYSCAARGASHVIVQIEMCCKYKIPDFRDLAWEGIVKYVNVYYRLQVEIIFGYSGQKQCYYDRNFTCFFFNMDSKKLKFCRWVTFCVCWTPHCRSTWHSQCSG